MFNLSDEIPNFYRQLAQMLDSGMPLIRCLSVLETQSRSRLKKVASTMKSRVEDGDTLVAAAAGFPAVFSPLDLNLIAAAEESGRVGQTLIKIGNSKIAWNRLLKSILSKLIYPVMVFHVAVGVKALLSFFLVSQEQAIRDLILGFGSAYAFAAFVLVAKKISVHQPWLSRSLQGISYFIPGIHGVIFKLGTARFTRTLESLLDAGYNMVRALELAARSCGNIVMETRLMPAVDRIKDGQSLSEALADTGLLSTMTLNMILTGEESGRLVEMLDKVSETTQFEAEQQIEFIGKVIPGLLYALIVIAVAIFIIRSFAKMFVNPINDLL